MESEEIINNIEKTPLERLRDNRIDILAELQFENPTEEEKYQLQKKLVQVDLDIKILEKLEKRENGELNPRIEDLEPITWQEFNKKEIPEISWRIKDLVPIEGFVTISSPSGEKKSWVALHMAKCISLGQDFLGEDMFKTAQAKVLYLDAENPEREILRRGRQLCFEDTEDLLIYHVNDINLNDEDKADDLLRLIKRKNVKVVIIDTFRAVAGGLKEEKAEEIRTFFNRFKILKDSGIVCIWLDHCRKRQNFEGKDPKKEQLLGSQDKTSSVEILIMISSDTGSEEIRVFQRKNRLGIEIAPFKILMTDEKDDKGNNKTTLKFGGLIEEQETKKEEAKELILEILSGDNKKTTKEIIGILGAEKKIGSKNARSALKELVDGRKIDYERLGKQNLYHLLKNTDNTVPDEGIFDFDEKKEEDVNFIDSS